MATNVHDNSVLHPNSVSARAHSAVAKSKQGQKATGNVVDSGAKSSAVPKNEFYTKKVFLSPKGRGNTTRSNKV